MLITFHQVCERLATQLPWVLSVKVLAVGGAIDMMDLNMWEVLPNPCCQHLQHMRDSAVVSFQVVQLATRV
jgi:hypothetical protein